MSGHNKWSQIKHQKGVVDKKRGALFSKILKAITIAAREPGATTLSASQNIEDNKVVTPGNANPRLRSLMERAKKMGVPQENINRAIQKTKDSESLEELVIEAYGPAGIAIIIYAITDNRNRTISEIKHLLNENEAKIANQGSVLWSFEGDQPKFPQAASEQDRIKIKKLILELENREDVQRVVVNLN